MKKLLLILLCLPMIGFGQWSNYYTIDVNQNINADVNVSGTINQNITTIDYGQLARANAEREKNRLSKEIFEDNRDSRIALEVASDPSKAFDYGEVRTFTARSNWIKKNVPSMQGIKYMKIKHIVPHKSLVSYLSGGSFQNISVDGVITEYDGFTSRYNIDNKKILSYNEYLEWEKDTLLKAINDIPKPKRNKYKSSGDYMRAYQKWRKNENPSERIEPLLNAEALAEMHHLLVGEVNLFEGDSVYVHKKTVKKATLSTKKGFLGTIIIEDKYEIKIVDNYFAYDMKGNGILHEWRITTYGDKNEITFESLEGRRHYFKKFNHKMAAGRAIISDFKF